MTMPVVTSTEKNHYDILGSKFQHLSCVARQVIAENAHKLRNFALNVRLPNQNLFPDVSISSSEVRCGDSVALAIKLVPPRGPFDSLTLKLGLWLSQGKLVEINYDNENVPSFLSSEEERTWHSYLGTTPLDDAGEKALSVTVHDFRHMEFKTKINLISREYPVESIWVPEEKVKGTPEEMAAVRNFTLGRNKGFWKLPFRAPSRGEITTEYGVRRYYNGIYAENYFHGGIDFGDSAGAPVAAPSAGVVALIGREDRGFRLHGNCVGVDHGEGVTSIFMHLDSVFVREGDVVCPGEVLGTVGSTGLATGPHLHWGLYVNGKCVNPHHWLEPWKQ